MYNRVLHLHLLPGPHVLGHDLGELVEGQVIRLVLEGPFAGHGRRFHTSSVGDGAVERRGKLRNSMGKIMGKN